MIKQINSPFEEPVPRQREGQGDVKTVQGIRCKYCFKIPLLGVRVGY